MTVSEDETMTEAEEDEILGQMADEALAMGGEWMELDEAFPD